MSDDQIPGGNPDETGGDIDENQEKKEKTVSYESYVKALDEKKKAQARLKELEDAEKKRAEESAKAKEDYKSLLDQREKELAEEREMRSKSEKRIERGVKLNAFLDELSGRLDSKYYKLIDLESIALDGDGGPDEASVRKAVKDFEASHPEVVIKESKGRMPNDAPKGGSGGKLKHEEWLRLPYDEQRKRMKDVVD